MGQLPNGQVKKAKVGPDFKKYGLNPSNSPEKWEDGMRSDGSSGTYEWWYLDSHLEDGSTAVIVFFTKHFNNVNKPLSPLITIEMERPDGVKIIKSINYEDKLFSSAKDSCDVRIGDNYFRGNLDEYEIHFEDEDLNITAKVTRTAESWRPKTGHMEFGEDAKDYFAWVVSVPAGKVDFAYTYKGEKFHLQGSCYHDHNWGNRNMVDLFNHWYWSRAEIGPYTIIASEMVAEKEYDNQNILVYNLSKNGKIIADNEECLKLYKTHGMKHPTLNKNISNELSFVYDDPKTGYRYEYNLYREAIIYETDLLLAALGKGRKDLKYRLIRLFTGFDGAYFRFKGRAEIKVFKDDKLIEFLKGDKAFWELMYFGK